VKTVKDICLGVAVAGAVAGAGSVLGCAVAYGEPRATDSADATASAAESAPAEREVRGTRAADRRRSGASVRAGRTDDSPRAAAAERGSARLSDPEPNPSNDSGARTPVAEAARGTTAPPVGTAAAQRASITTPTEAAAPAAVRPAADPVAAADAAPVSTAGQAVAAVAAPPAVAATPDPTPLAPLLPALPPPTAPVTPAAPASAVAVSASTSTSRARSAAATASQIGDPPEPTHVLLIGTDGTNLSKVLEYAYDDPASGFRMLMDDGVTGATSLVGHTTISGPSWSTILTGAWDSKTGVINNIFNPAPYDSWPTVFNLIEYHQPSVDTAIVANWQYMNDMAAAGGYPADVNEFVEFDTSWEDTDDEVAARTIALINSTQATDSAFIFSYQVAVDEAGHAAGGDSPEYQAALINTSENIAAILGAVDAWEAANPGQEWTVITTTDHGHQPQVGFGHGFQSPAETSSFVIFDLEGDGANDGRQNLGYTTADITPTIVSLFGVPQRSDFDGVPMQSNQSVLDGLVTPDNLTQALSDAIGMFGFPDVGTDIALGLRTVFASIPYFLDGFVTDITEQLQAIVDQGIFLLSPLAGAAEFVVQVVGDVLVGITQAVARTVGYLTGAGTIAPTDPPLPAPPADPAQVVLTAAQTALVTESPNLLVNPGAEFGDPSLSGYSAVTIPGWTLTGTPTVIQYGAPRNLWPIGTSFPMPNLPSFLGFPQVGSGPADGGNQFFGGGDVATGTLTQTVDLRGAAADIDQGTTPFNFSAWLGGYLFDSSGSSVKVTFLDDNKTYLGSAELSRVGALERWFQTGFKQRSTAGTLPIGTRYAQVVLTLEDRNFVTFGIPWLLGGVDFDYNNAFADNISFTIGTDLPAPPDPTPPVSAVGELDHVFMVYMENKGYNDIVGSTRAPFLNSLINAYGSATQYHGLTHPSLPNYYPVIGGTDFGLTYNCATPCIDAETTLVSNIEAAGKTWSGYAQSMPAPGTLEPSGDYSPDQLPFFAFSSIANDPARAVLVKPLEQMAVDLSSPETAPNYAWFAANENFNGEGPIDFPWGILKFALSQLEPGNPYNIPALDQFLSETVPVVLNSAVWQDPTRKSALIVTFDEDNNNTSLGFGNEGNQVVFVVIPSPGAVAAGMRSGAFNATDHYNHYSLLRFIEDALGLPPLTNNDKFAAPLNEFWDGVTTSGAGSLV